MNNIKAVVFDLYGTLIYIKSEVDTKAYTGIIRELGIRNGEELNYVRKVILTEQNSTIRIMVNKIKPNTFIDFNKYEKNIAEEISNAIIYPETISVLEELKKRNIKLGLISNLATPYKKPFYDFKLDNYFDVKIFSCDVGLKKPDPKIFNLMIKSLGFKPEEILMVGDSINSDYLGAKNIEVGMNALHLDRIGNSKNSYIWIKSLEDVLKYIPTHNIIYK
jgi:HAD superfamily hydrolase (TIGR01549 family)